LKFTPADIPHTSLRTMAKNVRRAIMPECEIYKIELAEGEGKHIFIICFICIILIIRNILIIRSIGRQPVA